jgi:hypothetical protein
MASRTIEDGTYDSADARQTPTQVLFGYQPHAYIHTLLYIQTSPLNRSTPHSAALVSLAPISSSMASYQPHCCSHHHRHHLHRQYSSTRKHSSTPPRTPLSLLLPARARVPSAQAVRCTLPQACVSVLGGVETSAVCSTDRMCGWVRRGGASDLLGEVREDV